MMNFQVGDRVQETGWATTLGTVTRATSADGWTFVHWDKTPERSVHSMRPGSLVRVDA